MTTNTNLRTLALVSIVGAAAAGAACQPHAGPPPAAPTGPAPTAAAAQPSASATVARESPPPSGPARDLPFPAISHERLDNGLEIEVLQAKALPVAQVRFVLKSGSAQDGDFPGLAKLTARMLKDGGTVKYSSRELLSRIETLGSDLGVEVGPDAIVLSLPVVKQRFGEALDLLASAVREPRFDAGEFTKLKKREVDKAADRAKSSGTWGATMMLWRELYKLPTGLHPYSEYDALPTELAKVQLANCRDFYKKYFSPQNAVLVVAGDVDAADVKEAAAKAFGAWKGGEVPGTSYSEPTPPEKLKIVLVDRPKSAQSDIFVATLGPHRKDDEWTDVKVANQVLGGGVSGRLFLDVREKRSLAYNTRSSVGELAHGPVPITAYAGTQTAKTGLAVQALLDNLRRISAEPASADEMNTARRFLSDVFAIRMETVGSLADMVATLNVLGLPDDYYDTYRKQLGAVSADQARKAIADYIREGHAVLVVAGDAERIATPLSHFGEVTVVNPEKGFERTRSVPANPQAPIELERQPGE